MVIRREGAVGGRLGRAGTEVFCGGGEGWPEFATMPSGEAGVVGWAMVIVKRREALCWGRLSEL